LQWARQNQSIFRFSAHHEEHPQREGAQAEAGTSSITNVLGATENRKLDPDAVTLWPVRVPDGWPSKLPSNVCPAQARP
jgi:hypothetical protein